MLGKRRVVEIHVSTNKKETDKIGVRRRSHSNYLELLAGIARERHTLFRDREAKNRIE